MTAAILTALVGLAGVVVGSLLTGYLSYLTQRSAEKRRWEREDVLRHQEDRKSAYARFLRTTEKDVPFKAGSRIRRDQELNELDDGYAEVQLLASPAVIAEAERLYLASRRARELDRLSPELPYRLSRRFSQDELTVDERTLVRRCRDQFLKVARKELGIQEDTQHPL